MATSFTHVVTDRVQTPTGTYDFPNSYAGSSTVEVDEDVTTGQTNFQINVAIDVSTIKSIVINSTQNVTLETNSGGSPSETINLAANVPYKWHVGSYFANLLATDITAIFITNSSGSTANVTLRCVQDSTP